MKRLALVLALLLTACGGADEPYSGDIVNLQGFITAYNQTYNQQLSAEEAETVVRNICTYAQRNEGDAQAALEEFAAAEEDPELGTPPASFLVPAFNAAVRNGCTEYEDMEVRGEGFSAPDSTGP